MYYVERETACAALPPTHTTCVDFSNVPLHDGEGGPRDRICHSQGIVCSTQHSTQPVRVYSRLMVRYHESSPTDRPNPADNNFVAEAKINAGMIMILTQDKLRDKQPHRADKMGNCHEEEEDAFGSRRRTIACECGYIRKC